MSIQSEINRIKAAVAAAYTAVSGKGGTIPTSKTSTNLATAINSIQTGVNTSDATAGAGDILSGKTAYVNGQKVTGSIPNRKNYSLLEDENTGMTTLPSGYYPNTVILNPTNAAQATPSISVDANGKITASATQEPGWVVAGTTSATKQLTTQAAATITPGTAAKTAVAAGRYTTGAVTVAGDANLKAENIKSGVSIFGVAGSYVGTGSGDSANNASTVVLKKNTSVTSCNALYPDSTTTVKSASGVTLNDLTFTTYGGFCVVATGKTSSNVVNIASASGCQVIKSLTSIVNNVSIFFVLPTSSNVTIMFGVTTSSGGGVTS